MGKKRYYFDYAASTPVDSAVSAAMQPYFSEKFGNPGSLHSFGQEAIAALDRARETVSHSIGAQFREVIFTSSATEANNLALYGAYFRFKEAYPHKTPKIITSAIEHESVIETARFLKSCGANLAIIPVEKNGVIDIKKLAEELDDSTCIVSIMYVNNEVGSVQPIKKIAKIIREYRTRNIEHGEGTKSQNPKFHVLSPRSYPLFHSDAAQAFCYFDCTVENLGVDLMTLSSQKMYGPKGAGALYARTQNMEHRTWNGNTENKREPALSSKSFVLGSILAPILHGGGQEFGMRSGTENIPAIVGMGKAVELADTNRTREAKRISELKNYFWRELKKIYPKAQINGPVPLPHSTFHILHSPHIINLFFPGHSSQDILTRLDLAGFALSAGSACSARSLEASHVLIAMEMDKKHALSSIRFSFGKPTTMTEIGALLKILKKIFYF
jgi:cysteine desulfurase